MPAASRAIMTLASMGAVSLAFASALFAAEPSPRSHASGKCTENTAVKEYNQALDNALLSYRPLVEALRQFPKGADLHNHLSGAVMPEDYLAMATANGDCFGPIPLSNMYTLDSASGSPKTCKEGFTPLAKAGIRERQKLLESLSMLNYPYPSIKDGHDQFFATFGRFNAVSGDVTKNGQMLTKLLQQAYRDNVSYVETKASFQSDAVKARAKKLREQFPDDASFQNRDNYPAMYEFLFSRGLENLVALASQDISMNVKKAKATLRCGGAGSDPACKVSYAFLSAANRKSDLPLAFTQIAFSFLLASIDPRVVGVDLVGGEDLPDPMKNFDTHMDFFSYFHDRFPKVNIALHAGELTPCFAQPEDLKKHLAKSLTSGAKRIGHGVSFAYLSEPDKSEIASLFKEKNALVEIMFTSNAQILGVAGDEHPFKSYESHGVPIAFSTDDGGVSHEDYTSEWIYGVQKYGLKLEDLKKLARESLQHSFMPGEPLWADFPNGRLAGECANATPGSSTPAAGCRTFLKKSAKARAQWDLEARLSKYEQSFGSKYPELQGMQAKSSKDEKQGGTGPH